MPFFMTATLPRYLDGVPTARLDRPFLRGNRSWGEIWRAAPCGCELEYHDPDPDRRVRGSGAQLYAVHVCAGHVRECPDCGRQTWPHEDCLCA